MRPWNEDRTSPRSCKPCFGARRGLARPARAHQPAGPWRCARWAGTEAWRIFAERSATSDAFAATSRPPEGLTITFVGADGSRRPHDGAQHLSSGDAVGANVRARCGIDRLPPPPPQAAHGFFTKARRGAMRGGIARIECQVAAFHAWGGRRRSASPRRVRRRWPAGDRHTASHLRAEPLPVASTGIERQWTERSDRSWKTLAMPRSPTHGLTGSA